MKKIFFFCSFVFLILTSKSSFAQVTPMITTNWNQTCYYNDSCPTVSAGGSCGKAFTGSHATAIAQIFKYYNYPESGMGNYCNQNNVVVACTDFSNQTYDYSLMPNVVSSTNSEVAKLMYHLGVALGMQWGGSSSISNNNFSILKKYFKYSPRMYSINGVAFQTTASLVEAIKAQIDAGQPVLAQSMSNYFLIDGYNASNQIHANFGKGGVDDGYYDIDGVTPIGWNYNPHTFIFNLRPMDGTLETANDTIYLSANSGINKGIEFTSLDNWSLTVSDSWITPNLSSGNTGYFNISNGSSFNYSINNDEERFGYIYINNGNDIDTIVVKQEASFLMTAPNNVNFSYESNDESIQVTYPSWGDWSASTIENWISLTPSFGTGNGSFNIQVSQNLSSTTRTGNVIVTDGNFSDTISVNQSSEATNSLSELSKDGFSIYPNPFSKQTTIQFSKEYKNLTLIFLNPFGQEVYRIENIDGNQCVLNAENLAGGMYFLKISVAEEQITNLLQILLVD